MTAAERMKDAFAGGELETLAIKHLADRGVVDHADDVN